MKPRLLHELVVMTIGIALAGSPSSGQTARAAETVLTVQPAAATAGSPVTVTGAGFPAGSGVVVSWPDQSILLGTASADDGGGFALEIIVPDAPVGEHVVRATSEEPENVAAEATFIVLAAPTATPVPPDTATTTPEPTIAATATVTATEVATATATGSESPATATPALPENPTASVTPTATGVPGVNEAALPAGAYAIAASSQSTNSTSAVYVRDGTTNTSWATLSATPPPARAWFTLRLRGSLPIARVGWVFSRVGAADLFRIVASDDGVVWTRLATRGNAAKAGAWQAITLATPVKARYIRFLFTNPNGDARVGFVSEVQIWPAASGIDLPTATPSPPPPPAGGSESFVLVGDIMDDKLGSKQATRAYANCAALAAEGLPFIALGDEQYDNGDAVLFHANYNPSKCGALKGSTRPVVGNHEYQTGGAAGYFGYFGSAASPRENGCVSGCLGYYAFDAAGGSWRVVVLNLNCEKLAADHPSDGCAAGTTQEVWLRGELTNARNSGKNVLVVSHQMRWSSNAQHPSASNTELQAMWADMVELGADAWITGHAHDYERFAPQDANGKASAGGLVQITAGTGGEMDQGLMSGCGDGPSGSCAANSVVLNHGNVGYLKITLSGAGVTFTFIPTSQLYGSQPLHDSGTIALRS